MADARQDVSSEASSRNVANAGWGLLLVWIGAALLLELGWATGLVGAGLIVLGAQAARRRLGLSFERPGLVLGSLLVLGGVWNLFAFDVHLPLVPLLCIAAGVALLVSAWTARRTPRAPGGQDLHAASHPRA